MRWLTYGGRQRHGFLLDGAGAAEIVELHRQGMCDLLTLTDDQHARSGPDFLLKDHATGKPRG